MNRREEDQLTKPKPVRFRKGQWFALNDISRRNHRISIAKLNRIAVDFLIKLVDLSNGRLPSDEALRGGNKRRVSR